MLARLLLSPPAIPIRILVRMKKIFYIFLFALSVLFLLRTPALAGPNYRGRGQYEKAIQFIREDNSDLALMEFRSIVRNFPESRYARESLFAIGEYFYARNAHYEAIKSFRAYIKDYPDSDGAIFARAYLLKMIQGIKKAPEGKKDIIEDIEADFFSEPLLLLFSEYKEVTYRSTFQSDFTIHHYIDMVEVYRNGELFIKITQ